MSAAAPGTPRIGRTGVVFAIGLALIVGAAVVTGLGARRHQDDRRWSDHTHAVRTALGRLSTHVQDLRNGRDRAVVLAKLPPELATVRTLVADNALQQRRVERLIPLLADAPAHLDELRSGIEEMLAEERTLQEPRDERARASLILVYLTTAGDLLLALVLFAIAWWRLTRQLREQHEMLARLRQSEAQTAALLENGVDAVWAVDRELKVTACNQRFRSLIGQVRASEDAPLELGELSFALSAEWSGHYQRVLAGEKVTIEHEHELDGRRRHFLVSLGPILVEGQVTGAAAFAKDISTRKRAELKLLQRAETLHYLSVVDQMTQLYNRRGFLELGQSLLREARAQGAPLAVLFVDLDGLKRINDQQGHAAGDAAISKAADALRHSVRRTDLVGRIGGDEFVVLATGMDDVALMIARIRAQGAERGLQMSIGVVREEPGDEPCTLEQLLEQADAVMYSEKSRRKTGT
jgi:diguanylate cyclase (GGDEF)-like protein/PAS domain S-box-containing protein